MPSSRLSWCDWNMIVCCCPHHQLTIMVQTHQDSREEGMTTPFHPQEPENIWRGSQKSSKGSTAEPSRASDCKALQRVVRTTQYITGAKLPAIQDRYSRRCQRKAQKIVRDSSRPSHRLYSLLPHIKRYRSATSRTKRLLNSFYPQALRLLNS